MSCNLLGLVRSASWGDLLRHFSYSLYICVYARLSNGLYCLVDTVAHKDKGSMWKKASDPVRNQHGQPSREARQSIQERGFRLMTTSVQLQRKPSYDSRTSRTELASAHFNVSRITTIGTIRASRHSQGDSRLLRT